VEQTRRELRRKNKRRHLYWLTPRSEIGLLFFVLVGFLGGLFAVFFRGIYLPSDYEADSRKIESIANGSRPEFSDSSFTPIARIYEAIGLGGHPLLAALLGYLLASITLLMALYIGRRRTANWLTVVYLLSCFFFAGIYLGQYSKDVFLLPVVIVLIVLPSNFLWDAVVLVLMSGAAYLFRDYWALIAVAYLVLRAITVRQIRLRYLLGLSSIGVVGFGLAIYAVMGRDPNHYRTSVQGKLDAATFIHPIDFFAQPFSGLVDIFVQFWLLLLPIMLPFTAGVLYLVITCVLGFARLMPLQAVSSRLVWPRASSSEGATLRRAISLLVAFTAVQALFEPDYGSVLRHLTPMLGLGVIILQIMRTQRRAEGWKLTSWSWSVR